MRKNENVDGLTMELLWFNYSSVDVKSDSLQHLKGRKIQFPAPNEEILYSLVKVISVEIIGIFIEQNYYYNGNIHQGCGHNQKVPKI